MIVGNVDDVLICFLVLGVGDKLVGLGYGDVYDEGLWKWFLEGEFVVIGVFWYIGLNLEVLLEIKFDLILLIVVSFI